MRWVFFAFQTDVFVWITYSFPFAFYLVYSNVIDNPGY